MTASNRQAAKRGLVVYLSVITAAIVILAARQAIDANLAPTATTPFPNLRGQRVMVISPHPDDESLACAGVILRAGRVADAVEVLWINDGDANPSAARFLNRGRRPDAAAYLSLGKLRHREALQAAGDLGLPLTSMVFLCYPDGATNSLWDRNRYATHVGANGRVAVENNGYAWRPGAPYTGRSLESDLTAAVKAFQPTVVIYPDLADQHHDHWATALFTGRVLRSLRYRGAAFTYITHHGCLWPWPPWLDPAGSISPLEHGLIKCRAFTLDLPWADEARKIAALSRYRSQGGLLAPSINAFVRVNEVFYAKM